MPSKHSNLTSHSTSAHENRVDSAETERLTFTLVLIPGVDTVLHAVAHQGVVYAHVAVTEEGIWITWSWKGRQRIDTVCVQKVNK